MTDYNLKEHRHIFAAWCASTAARTSKNCRFTVEMGRKLIEASALIEASYAWEQLPAPDAFDSWHTDIRDTLCNKAPRIIGEGSGKSFTHGVAAKLTNCYLKALYLSSVFESDDERQIAKLNAIHPPIDRVLMNGLLKSNEPRVMKHKLIWRSVNLNGWSAMGSSKYQQVIDAIRDATQGQLWRIENYWKGHQ